MTTALELAPVPFAAQLARYGDSPAIHNGTRTISYTELADLVAATAARLGPIRRLVALTASNDLDSLVAYLAALSGNHPLILLPADKPAALDSLVAAYDPDVIMRSGTGEPEVEERRPGTRHELHPGLALLLSTSGSTGSPKLVRLSLENLQSNAESIAEYLHIGPDDRAATTLPMSYCYGLSVINSHLLRGASLVLTDLSVVDPCFWDLFRSRRATSFAAVPYTFELLERVGFADMDLPSLRYVTQAGGRLGPDNVRHYAELGARRGWDLFVMYGQTEATARMAYLPPDLAASNPGTIGIPVPGGQFRIDPVAGMDHGELVYSGPNIMLGYAETPQDLALGRTVDELRTGDLAVQHTSGLYEVVGRRSRFLKIVGVRIDLGQVEAILSGLGVVSAATGTDESLVVAVEGSHDPRLLGKVLCQDLGLPRAAVHLVPFEQLPRLGTGKTDYPAVLALAAAVNDAEQPATNDRGVDDVRTIFAEALECTHIQDHDTFVSLGGDSLSYVAASVRLEKALGHLPPDWHVTPVRDLRRKTGSAHRPKTRAFRLPGRWIAPVETSIALRAVAIILIVSTHISLFKWQGMAHVLIAVAGFNFARFQLSGERLPRLRRQLRSLARIVVPSILFIAGAYLLTDKYSPANILLLNSIVGPEAVTSQWHFWFIELLVYILLAVTALLAIPWMERAERRVPFAFPIGLTALGLLARFEIVDTDIPHGDPALWLFALGWAVARSKTLVQKCSVSVIAILTVPGFWEDTNREATLLAGILILVWLRGVPLPTVLHRPVGLLASASMYIYLTHWVVYPGVLGLGLGPVAALAASLVVGVAYWAISSYLFAAIKSKRRRTPHSNRNQQPQPPAVVVR